MDPLFNPDRLLEALERNGLDALVVTSRSNFIYLTGIYQQIEANVVGHRHDGAAVVSRRSGAVSVTTIVPWVDEPLVREHSSALRTIGYVAPGLGLKGLGEGPVPANGFWAADVSGEATESSANLPGAVARALQEDGVDAGKIGYEDETLPVAFLAYLQASLPASTWVPDAEGLLSSLRLLKTPEEVRRLRESAMTAERAHYAFQAALSEGATERELHHVVATAMLQGRAERIVFIDLGIGENSALPHGEPTDRSLAPGEVVRFDGGVAYGGYVSDIGRSYVLGEATEAQHRAHETCLRTYERMREMLGPGVAASDLYRAQAQGLGDYFAAFPLPYVAHGLGLEIHEPPFVSADSQLLLEPGIVINIEPGVWVPGKEGIFVENSFLITEGGSEPLTRLDMTVLAR